MLVPVGVEAPDAQSLETQLNAIYAPYGVEFTVKTDESIKGLEGWKGRTFKLEGNGFFTRENADMAEMGNGWFAGEGVLTLPWIFEVDVAVRFDRLRLNTDRRQIDGRIETVTDPKASQIANTNQLDNGRSKLEQGGIALPKIEVDFTVPDRPSCTYNEDTGELVITDEDGGNPQMVTVPKNQGKSSFPIEVVDKQGNRYQVEETMLSAFGEEIQENKNNNKNINLVIRKLKDDYPYASLDSTYHRVITKMDIKHDTTNTHHNQTALIVIDLLAKYIENNGSMSLPQKIKIQDMNTGRNPNFSYILGYDENANTLIFDTKFYTMPLDRQKSIIEHEAAHYLQRLTYPVSFANKEPVLSSYYVFIKTYISQYPEERKESLLQEYKNVELAELHYNREVFAELVNITKSNKELFGTLKRKLSTLTDKKNNGSISNTELKTLEKLSEKLESYKLKIDEITNILTVK